MAQHTNLQGYFITGSDTGVGKTWISRQIIGQLLQTGMPVKARKPVESGCGPLENGTLFPADGNALNQACAHQEDLGLVTPYRFQATLAPDQAARMENKSITLAQLVQAVKNELAPGDCVVVEGAGGFYSPIAADGLNADLAKALQLPLIVVVDDRLGAINQALLTINAVHREGLKLSALVLNQASAIDRRGLDNLSELQSRTKCPVYPCPLNGCLPAIDQL